MTVRIDGSLEGIDWAQAKAGPRRADRTTIKPRLARATSRAA
jgi:hypothetical protein